MGLFKVENFSNPKFALFLVSIVLESSSIWVAAIICGVDKISLSIGLTTVAIASCSSVIEKLWEHIFSKELEDAMEFLWHIILLLLPLVASLCIAALINHEHECCAVLLSIVIFLAYLRSWWFLKKDNDPFAATGGDARQFRK